jgi:hypothetical protein
MGGIASVVSIASGVNSLMGGGGGSGSSGGAATTAAADPFAPYRGGIADIYSGILTGKAPVDATQMPGYAAYKTGVMDPALEASKRSAAASGMMRSGNEDIALTKTAGQGYYGFMTDYMNRLAQGSGAAQNPAQAVGLGLGATQAGYQGLGQGIGALASQFGGGGGSYGGGGGGITSAGMQAQTYVPYGGGDALPMGYANF